MKQTLQIAQVLDAERLRATAVVARDLAALRESVHDELVYVHATGLRHSKAEWLDFVDRGPVACLAVELNAQQAVEADGSVLLHGELRLRLRRMGETADVAVRSWASALWLRDASGRWALRLFHSTRPSA